MLTLQLNIYYWGKAKLLKLFPPGKVKRLLDAPGSGCDRSPLTASPIGVPGELPQSAIASPAAYNLSTERAAAAGIDQEPDGAAAPLRRGPLSRSPADEFVVRVRSAKLRDAPSSGRRHVTRALPMELEPVLPRVGTVTNNTRKRCAPISRREKWNRLRRVLSVAQLAEGSED